MTLSCKTPQADRMIPRDEARSQKLTGIGLTWDQAAATLEKETKDVDRAKLLSQYDKTMLSR